MCIRDRYQRRVHGLAGAIRLNKKLSTLDLNENKIGDKGAQFLVKALTSNSTLTTLSLKRNKLTDKTIEELRKADKIYGKCKLEIQPPSIPKTSPEVSLYLSTRRIRLNPYTCLLYTSPSPRDLSTSRMPSSA
eukprot:TRINITY_DN6510_c0_g1_i1.p1 TRINITY_DN6510_c0_g1~~TRINITY_DN6510_c0_g1_i1.p1  ORF type:complete len:133 (-),score=25.49 TRINITY_DN6510_c0_g1_i1:62-460(-)